MLVRSSMWVVLTCLCFLAPNAYAWIPSASVMERKLETHRRPAMNLRIELKSAAKSGVPVSTAEVLSTKEGVLVLREHHLSDGTVHVKRWQSGHKDASKARRNAPEWLQWLTGKKAHAMFRDLALDRKTVSLARDGRNVLWVAGATAHEPTRPQVHLERESGVLRKIVQMREERIITASFSGHFVVEQSTTHWPSVIAIQDGERTITYEVVRILEKATITDNDLAPQVIKPFEESR